jgi:hypothetical protein
MFLRLSDGLTWRRVVEVETFQRCVLRCLLRQPTLAPHRLDHTEQVVSSYASLLHNAAACALVLGLVLLLPQLCHHILSHRSKSQLGERLSWPATCLFSASSISDTSPAHHERLRFSMLNQRWSCLSLALACLSCQVAAEPLLWPALAVRSCRCALCAR